MKQFKVKVTGSGTKAQIIGALKQVIVDIEATSEDNLEDFEAEDATLFTEIYHNGYYKADKD